MQPLKLPDSAKLRASLAGLSMHPWLLFLAVGLLVWLPGGFNIGPHNPEAWSLLQGHKGATAVLDPMKARLFRDVPVWLGLQITPRGFQGWQIMIMLLTVLRGGLMYEIVRRMVPQSLPLALACGLVCMFHPADSGYFWLNTTGVQFGLMLALASCLCALVHLESGRRASLMFTYLFQTLSGLTYAAFMPLMFAIPAGAWWLRRSRGGKTGVLYLARIGTGIVLLLLFEWVMVMYSKNRDARVADLNLHEALRGFVSVGERILTAPFTLAGSFEWQYLLPMTAVGVVALLAAWRAVQERGRGKTATRGKQAGEPAPDWRWYATVFAGLLLLAALAYLPYSITTIRYADRRQLLGAGIFGYSALLFLVFMALKAWVRNRWVPVAAVVVVAVAVTLTGLEKRVYLLERYHSMESMLAAIATVAPNPKRHSYIVVHLEDESQAQAVGDAYKHLAEFSYALQYIYDDRSLRGGFYGFGYASAVVDSEALKVSAHSIKLVGADQGLSAEVAQQRREHFLAKRKLASAPYTRLILVDYPLHGAPALLGQDFLKQHAPTPAVADAIHYDIPAVGTVAAARANICTVFEPAYRPGYCGMTAVGGGK